MPKLVRHVALLAIAAFLAGDALALGPDAANLAEATQSADLRGYGEVTAEFSKGHCVFACTDPEHADIVLGKMLADLFWDAGDNAKKYSLDVDGVAVTVHAWAPYGVLCVGRVGTQVMAFGAADDAALLALLRQHPEFVKASPAFSPAKPYPRFLDHYDLRAYKAYTGAMSSSKGMGLESHWPFIKKFGLGGIAFQGVGPGSHYPAPGVINFVSGDYEMKMAQEQGSSATVGVVCGGQIPLWIYNRIPDAMMQPSPTTLLGAWNGPGPVGGHYESWWLPADRRENGSLLFMRQAMEHYRDNPALSAWHLYTGAPGVELAFHNEGEFWDYSPVGQAAFRAWLRDTCKYTLKQLGERWYGDANRFNSWEQVQLPDINGFFGALDDTCLRLADGWQWASARDGVQTPPPADDKAWIPVAMPPSQQQVLLPWGEAFYRIEFDGNGWAKQSKAWISCNTLLRADHPTIAWLNGEKVAEFESNNNPLPFSIPMAGKIKPGRNELILRIPRQKKEEPQAKIVREGKIFGPVFLTATEPRLYPYLGEHANARYVDVRQWQAAGVFASHETMLNLALAMDPEHPFTLSGGANLINEMSALAEKYGTSCQNTGRNAAYFPTLSSLGLVGGFYGTSEEGGTAGTESLTRELGWMLLDGDANHDLYQSLEDYQLEEQKSGWFTKHQRAIQCFGKYLRAMPQIAIIKSGVNMRLAQLDRSLDLGVGTLQRLHYDNAYATEVQILNGKIDACPVLMDSGNEIMDDDVVAALARYVERGGTFIAMQRTGRHTTLQQDAQPLARLTGVMATSRGNGRIRLSAEASFFGTLVEREFSGDGFALKPAPAGVAVAGESPLALARWEDGSIAISSRRVGKGQVIQLGSPFWHDRGEVEKEFLERLFTHLGVTRVADASDGAIWARKATTKNGLQDWLLTRNDSNVARAADVRLAVDAKPAQVWDLLSGKPVAAAYANGWITIPNVQYEPQGTRLFAVKRADLVDGLAFWWGEKTKYWRRPPAMKSPAVAAAKAWVAAADAQKTDNHETIPFSQWRFLADRAGSTAGSDAWLTPGFSDRNWKLMDNGPWNLLDSSLADWHGTGLYRAAFTVPDSWKGQRIILRLYDINRPIVYDQGEFFVNGTRIAEYKAHNWYQAYAYDVTPLLRPGVESNILCIRVQGGKLFSGIGGSIWLEPRPKFAKELDLAGAWLAVKPDYHTTAPVQLPGVPTARYLKREFELPRDWSRKSVYLHLESDEQCVALVVLNGKLIGNNSALHPYSPITDVNVTPYLVEGTNRIELWPYGTIPGLYAQETKAELPIPLRVVRLGMMGE